MPSESMAAVLLSMPPEPWAAAGAAVAIRVAPQRAEGLARSAVNVSQTRASDPDGDEWALAGYGVHGGLS